MTDPAQRSRRPGAYGIAPPLLLTAVLVAVAVLFVQTWNGLDERRTFGERERQGVEYVRSLHQVTAALVDTQVTTAAGRTPSRDALNQAVEAMTSVDARLGDTLRTRERWAGVRAKIEALPERGLARPPRDIYNAYSETGTLLLALYAKVRESSGLIRDPDADAYHLQDSAAEELPEALIAAGRLANLTRLARNRGPDDEIRTATEFTAARAAVLEPSEDLVAGLQSAVNNTDSQQLSGSLLRPLDAYQQAVEKLAVAAATAGPRGPDPEPVEAARKAVQEAATQLFDVVLTELDALITTRLDGLAGQRRLAAATAAIGLLLGLGLAYLLLAPSTRKRNTMPGPDASGPGASPADAVDATSAWNPDRGWGRPEPFGPRPDPADDPAAVGVLAASRGTATSPDPGPRSDRPAQWGQSDAAR